VVQEGLPVTYLFGKRGKREETEGNWVAQLVGTVGVGTVVADNRAILLNIGILMGTET
jgi:hypothetical protein